MAISKKASADEKSIRKEHREPLMDKLVQIFHESGMTLDELGQAMSYEPSMARKAAWQFIRKTGDPRLCRCWCASARLWNWT